MSILVQVLAAVGVLTLIPLGIRFISFVWFYFLRPSTVRKYLHGAKPYALITGATDGIGRAIATELYDKGFNLILHGRNEERMQSVISDLKKRPSAGADVRYFLADATQSGLDFPALVAPFSGLDITLVVQNVGGLLHPLPIDEQTEDQLLGNIRWNALFALLLTRALLPHLRSTAARGPVLVQFVGSILADIPFARVTAYGASKGFLRSLVRGLDNDETLWGPPSGVRFAYLNAALVQSGSIRLPETLMLPSAARFARAVVRTTGCGRRAYVPYWPHAVQIWLVGLWDEWWGAGIIDRANTEALRENMDKVGKDE